jgi:hypothetical protein
MDRLIQELEERGKTVVLVGPVAQPDVEVASIVARQMAFHHKVTEPMFLPETEFMENDGDIIDHYASRNGIIFIRPDEAQCKLNRCDYFRDSEALLSEERMWLGFTLNLIWAGCLLTLAHFAIPAMGARGLAYSFLGAYSLHMLTTGYCVLKRRQTTSAIA